MDRIAHIPSPFLSKDSRRDSALLWAGRGSTVGCMTCSFVKCQSRIRVGNFNASNWTPFAIFAIVVLVIVSKPKKYTVGTGFAEHTFRV
jgi:hypothetical protein